MPEMIGITRSSRPTAWATWVIVPTGMVAMNEVKRCSENIRRWMGIMASPRAQTSVSRQRRQLRPVATERLRQLAVLGEIGEVGERGLGEAPLERLAKLLGEIGADVTG